MLIRPMLLRNAAPVVLGTAWSPADKPAYFTLSNGNLTVAGNSSANGLIRATTSRSTDKYYYEIRQDNGGSNANGFSTATPPNTSYPGATSDSIGYLNQGGQVYFGGSVVATLSSTGAGAVVMFAGDLSLGLYWFGANGAWFNGNPEAGTGGISGPKGNIFPAADPFSGIITARFTTGFSYAPPSGFSNWG